jgi:hypothetical protein
MARIQFASVLFFHFSKASRPTRGPAKPLIYLASGGLSPGWGAEVAVAFEADYSPSSSAEVKNDGLYLHSPICLHGIVLSKLSVRTLHFTL